MSAWSVVEDRVKEVMMICNKKTEIEKNIILEGFKDSKSIHFDKTIFCFLLVERNQSSMIKM